MNIKEFYIPVPWGHIAAKSWWNENNIPILLFHGMGDNAGAFDQLIPHLPTTFYYISIDLPGHGRSSHFPQHLPLYPLNTIFAYKLVVDYLKRKKYIIIGHSWGGRTATFFTQLYPEHVLKLILLDTVYLAFLSVKDFKEHITSQIEQLIEINKALSNKTRPSYTYEEALKKIQQSRACGRELHKEAAESLLRRTLIAKDDKQFHLSHDIRIRTLAVNLMLDRRFANDLIKVLPVSCPVLIIIASESSRRLRAYKSIIDGIRSTNNRCFVKTVQGDHDIHMKQPEIISALINNFLNTESKL